MSVGTDRVYPPQQAHPHGLTARRAQVTPPKAEAQLSSLAIRQAVLGVQID